jgi:hypothetical protein
MLPCLVTYLLRRYLLHSCGQAMTTTLLKQPTLRRDDTWLSSRSGKENDEADEKVIPADDASNDGSEEKVIKNPEDVAVQVCLLVPH